MKIQLEHEDIQAIARELAEMVKPLLNRTGNDEAENIIFDVKGVAEYLGVEQSWIYRQVCEKNIPYFKVGKYDKFKKTAIDKWISSQTVEPSPPLRLVTKKGR